MHGIRSGTSPEARRLTVRATVAPELVDDLTDLLGRVTGRAASDEAGSITITLAPGVSVSDLERDLRTVLERWSEMHPGVRVRVTPSSGSSRPSRRWKVRKSDQGEGSAAMASDGAVR
jgi:hypothetical protein